MPSPSAITAVLFDLDGTLYHQRPLRMRMARELALFVLRRPVEGGRTARVLRAFRHAQETLRMRGVPYDEDVQIEEAASRVGLDTRAVRAVVREWMFERPLPHLLPHRAAGSVPLLDHLAARGIRAGVLSDYAAVDKLEALGLRQRFSVVLAAGDPDVRALKPSPRGFLAAASRWGVRPGQVLVVGDRVDADGAGAEAAGMASVIVTRRAAGPVSAAMTFVNSLEQVKRVIDDRC